MKLLNRMRRPLSVLRIPESRGFWITTSVVFFFVGIALTIVFWDWLSGGESGSTTIRNIGFIIAGSVAIPLAIWRGVVADKQASAAGEQTDTALEQVAIAQRSLLSERYQRGAEMLGSKVLSVRQGGIYTLRRLVEKYGDTYHVEVIRLLCAFVRHPTRDDSIEIDSESHKSQDEPARKLRADVEDAMQALGSRSLAGTSLELNEDYKLYLRDANLSDLQIQDAKLSNAWLTNANLSGAVLPRVDLSGARLRRTDLSGAKLWGANLSRANLRDANLSGTDFCGADAQSRNYNAPARGLTQTQLNRACADPDNPPKLDGVVDAVTGEPLVWRGGPCKDEQSN